MPNIVMTKLKKQPKYNTVRLRILDFPEKLAEDDSTYGLRVKQMNQDVAPRPHPTRVDRSWRAVDAGTVAVLARTNDRALSVADAPVGRSIPANHVTSAQETNDHVPTLTMHTAKGMEFSRVILFDVSDGVVPSTWMLDSAASGERNEVLLRERSLLYVAASRARNALAVTWSGSPSPLLHADTPNHEVTTEEHPGATI